MLALAFAFACVQVPTHYKWKSLQSLTKQGPIHATLYIEQQTFNFLMRTATTFFCSFSYSAAASGKALSEAKENL